MMRNSAPLLLALLSVLLSPTVEAQAKPPAGFGRFGRLNDDGLLTLNVSPRGFETPAAYPLLNAQFGDGTARAHVLHLDTTEKTLQLIGGGNGAPVRLRYTLLYPGFGAVFGKRLVLHLKGSPEQPVRIALTPLAAFGSRPVQRGLLILPTERSGIPLVLAFRPGFQPRRQRAAIEGDGAQILVEGAEPIGEVRVCTPLGLQPWTPLYHPASSPDTTALLRKRIASWLTRPIPTRVSSSYTLSPDGRFVTITDTYRKERGETIAPLPPVLAFAHTRNYPARISGKVVYADCITKWGAFAYARGTTLRYTLPVPPTEERGYVRATSAARDQAKRIALLNELVGHLGGDWAQNGVDLGYAGMANAQMAWAWLSASQRNAVRQAWRAYLPLAFQMPPYPPDARKKPWKVESEPFTRQSYIWTYFIDGPEHRRYDLDWGNALPLYGVYKFAQYTGGWQFARKHWAAIQRIARYFDLGDDWAWMTVVNADHGYSTGTGDPMAATFCGMLACLKMARALGDHSAEARFAYRAARVAVPMVSRLWYREWARNGKLIGPNSIALGFQEQDGFTAAQLGREDPWGTTNILSGDGALPELFLAMRAFGGTALADYEAEFARGFPDWYKGGVHYAFPTTYNGNSVYVTFPHIFARALLDEPTDTLWKYVDAAQSNRNNAWIGPNVLAELLSRDAPLVLTEWQPAAYRDGFVSPDGRTVTLEFFLPSRTRWKLFAALRENARPFQVRINGKMAPFNSRAGRLMLQTVARGNVRVEIFFGG